MIHAFVSHSSKNHQAVLSATLRSESPDVKYWIAPRDIPDGARYGDVIADAITRCDVVMVIVTADSLKSPMVKRELDIADETGTPILPIRITGTSPSTTQWTLAGLQSAREAGWNELPDVMTEATHTLNDNGECAIHVSTRESAESATVRYQENCRAPVPVLNAIEDNHRYGDEARFFSILDPHREEWTDALHVAEPQEVTFRAYLHNSAVHDPELTITGARIRVSRTGPTSSGFALRASVITTNGHPRVIDDDVTIMADFACSLSYVAGSGQLVTHHGVRSTLPDTLWGPTGTPIGSMGCTGEIPPGYANEILVLGRLRLGETRQPN